MQYLIQIYSNDSMFRYDGLSEEEKEAVMGEYFAISGAPGVTGGGRRAGRCRSRLAALAGRRYWRCAIRPGKSAACSSQTTASR